MVSQYDVIGGGCAQLSLGLMGSVEIKSQSECVRSLLYPIVGVKEVILLPPSSSALSPANYSTTIP